MPNDQAQASAAFFKPDSSNEAEIQKALVALLNKIKILATTGNAEEQARYALLRRICTKIKSLAGLKNRKYIPGTKSTDASGKPEFNPETDVGLLDPTTTINNEKEIWAFLAGITITSDRKYYPAKPQRLKDRLPHYFTCINEACKDTVIKIEGNEYECSESELGKELETICQLIFDLVKCRLPKEEQQKVAVADTVRRYFDLKL